MAGQLIQRGGRTWLVRVYLGRDPQSGKRRYHNHTVNGNKKDAQRYLTEKLQEIDLGTFVEPSVVTVGEYLDKWLMAAAKPRLTELTFQHYEDLLRRYVRPTLGNAKLGNVRPLDIQTLYTGMQDGGLSARVVRYTHAVLNSALKQAVKWRLMPQNPAAMVDLPRVERKEMQALTPAEASRFLAAAATDRFKALFNLALITGMRPSEYLGLQWPDISFEAGTVTVQRTLTWTHRGTYYFGETKTKHSRRNIPLPVPLLSLLKEHKRGQGEERLRAGAGYQNLSLVFCGKEGQPIMPHNLIVRHFKPILKEANLPKTVRLYDLRHTCATLLLAGNENPKVVSERLGHASITLTLDTYSHVLPTMQQAASDKLEKMLFSKIGTQ
jgi:integrase